MNCPVCNDSPQSNDFSIIEKRGKRVILKGEIHAIISPSEAHYPPFSDYFTVSLYPRKGKMKVKYLKFKTLNELEKWGFIKGVECRQIRCEGCLHEADGKELVFDITSVEFLS